MFDEQKYKLLTCYHCGNKGLMHIEHVHKETFGGPILDAVGNVVDFDSIENYRWFTLSCPVCSNVALYEECDDDFSRTTFSNNLYPPIVAEFKGVPINVKSAFESALKVKNIDSAICLISLRRVLEAICKEKNANGNTLYDMVKDMIAKKILPEMFDDACWIIRELGNSAAHAENKVFYKAQVEQTIDFVKTIINYLYVLPEKMRNMREIIQLAKNNEKAVR